jgi:hypothetical protein
MPNTYTELRQTVVGTATGTVTLDLTGISGYTDLVLVSVTKSTTGNNTRMTFNNDASALYSNTSLGGTGSSAVSRRDSGVTYIRLDWDGYNQTTEFNVHTTHIQNYSNTNTFKTVLTRSGSGPTGVDALVSLYRSTNAITRIDVIASTGSFDVGSTFSLYGIANADQGAAKATGGIITEDATYWYHTFAASGTFTPKQSLSCDYLVVAGGGGGGSYAGGGGGAGGYLTNTLSVTATAYTVTIGAGGNGGAFASGAAGSNSVFGAVTATGGGFGGGAAFGASGGAGGSGGGTSGSHTGLNGTAGAASPSGQGNAGGASTGGTSTPWGGAGGGGAGAVGASVSGTTAGGNGGAGLASSINGTSTTRAGGGGGGADPAPAGTGGTGGGGNGAVAANATAGTANTGGGGGGVWSPGYSGGAGGSGIVIVRYLKA